MATMRAPRVQVGSTAWIIEERNAALQIAQSEVEEFSYSARNEFDWLNEHMAGIFNENETNFAEAFKTPGKLRGKASRTVKAQNPLETRAPLSEVFSATPNGMSNPNNRIQSTRQNDHAARGSPSLQPSATSVNLFPPKQVTQPIQDSGYFGSQDAAPLSIHMDTDPEDVHISPRSTSTFTTTIPHVTRPNCAVVAADTTEKTLPAVEENQIWQVSAETSKKPAAETKPTLENTSDAVDDASPERHLSREAKEMIDYADDVRSASDGSSPIRPIVRKSSLNFASLPAREPLTAGKSIGARVSRTSHLESIRTSHYNRQTGGKSLGGTLAKPDLGESQEACLDVNDATDAQASKSEDPKTYTQRLQDQINQLGQCQPKHGHNLQQNKTPAPKVASPIPFNTLQSTPGAFPEDDDDDWIEPPATISAANERRPSLPKSHSADVMEGIQGKRTIGEPDFDVSEDESLGESQTEEQQSEPSHAVGAYGHAKSASVPVIPNVRTAVGEVHGLKRVVSASNPSLLPVVQTGDTGTPTKSHSRNFRESPLKQVKNKLSSILKSSRGLLASSAAISAEGKLLTSPSSTRLGLNSFMSSESLASLAKIGSHSSAAQPEGSPTRPMRRTRASAEREEKKREREAKRLEEQNLKLEKARQKEEEKARVFSKEQERLAGMEKQIAAKKDEGQAPEGELSKPTRSGHRNMKAVEDDTVSVDKDVDMDDASVVPPPSILRSLGPAHATRNKELKRPAKPTRETQNRPKQAPTVIRVNTGSQHSQYRPSTAPPDVSNHTVAQAHQLVSKASKASLQTKPSTQSLRGAAASRAKTQELASRKKEQEEREAQRRRDAKAEMERKKTTAQEEQRRQEQHKRQEADRQRQPQQELSASQSQFKSSAQRKAAIEKAKQTRAPPPAVRPQPNAPPDFSMSQESQAVGGPSRMTSNAQWSQEETNRPVNAVLSTASKASAKRAFTYDKGDESQPKHLPSRGGPPYQANDAKRRRTSENLDEETDASTQRNIRGPPLRPSSAFKKEMPAKSVFQNGFANAPPPSSAPNLFKATLSSQHASQTKAAHPLDLAQISKGAIPFQPTPNAAGSAYKTPARSGPAAAAKSTAKSGARSSPRFQNGEAIELPEIQTDDESEDDESHGAIVAPWADSPDLRKALMRQETMDPSQIFGPPAPLNMEEVFNKSKDRFHKFRARTSSANWSGADRLTEEDIRKDLLARDKLRRDGGWSYEMSKDML
ncbi:hypothetical protein E4U42_003105 [Claviceps africana]|uniref:Inner centromere protein ARK-binding domain-containing protein n=1 Tax=Claviceps africana TaxID=83212 RepID=A0A8K0NI41_9HYPO|nr:hypothetical protein E4U42_003105 [Claviceps africana]